MGTINPVNKSFCLEKLFETNYKKLFRLFPNLMQIDNKAAGYSEGSPVLNIQILERTPYTITVLLSHSFQQTHAEQSRPSVKIRVYQDVQLAEVIRDHNHEDVSLKINKMIKIKEILDYKWSLNYFLEKWLDYCLYNNYQFSEIATPVATSG